VNIETLNYIISEIRSVNSGDTIHWIDKQVLENLIELAHIAHYGQIEDKALDLLNKYKYKVNFEDDKVLNNNFKIPSREIINRKHPKINQVGLITSIKELNQIYLSKALERDYKGAFQLVKSEMEMQDVIIIQLILGDFEKAAMYLEKIKDDFRKESLFFMHALELYRQGRVEMASPYIKKSIEKQGIHKNIWFAWIIENRIPWKGYPFLD